jgi:hypothetical protein
MQAEKYEDEFGGVDIEKEPLDETLNGDLRQMILITVEDSGIYMHIYIHIYICMSMYIY